MTGGARWRGARSDERRQGPWVAGQRAQNGHRDTPAHAAAGKRLEHGAPGATRLTRELVRAHLANEERAREIDWVEPSRARIVQRSACMIGDAVTWIEGCEHSHGACA